MIFNSVKLWTISLAKRHTASYWLGFIAFIESFIFFIPVDVLYIPLTIVRPQKAYSYAFIATICSVFGGIVGWCLGYFTSDTIVKPLLEFTNQYENFQTLHNDTTQEFLAILLTVSGLIHLPPIKITTLLAGVTHFNLWLFILLCILSRGIRFYFFAWLIQRFGSQATHWLSHHFKWLMPLGFLLFLFIYGLYTFFLKPYFSF
ncbi:MULTISPECIES: YqaA family protein [unclassified Bartonella]|uniref:YqaA family protein n=1 Tax=unclassified Bartonella TaxID=2645622 RepID=UPI00099A5296|nr:MULTISPECIES: DedA family protein [unclassified Bartonella]AQX28434.1 membrane protein YqaA, SNARE-associated domain [Bartonella sp. JB15]AQX29700.1 membrane protein YqaA, SNARE-associated domain [Bartonella sp. JB63]